MLTDEQIDALDLSDQDATRELIRSLVKQIKEQNTLIASLTRRVNDLEERLAKDSHNSSKPPSSDGYGKKPRSTEALDRKRKRKRKSGGQKGHKGSTLEMSATPDETQVSRPQHCEHCRRRIGNSRPVVSRSRRQEYTAVFQMRVLEYQVEEVECAHCGTRNKGEFPEHIKNKTQYSPKLRGLIAYLKNYQLLPNNRIVEFMEDVLGHSISEGTIHKLNRKLYNLLEPAENFIKKELLKSAVMGNDETGVSVSGKLHWLHSASTDKLTFLQVHEKRGKDAIDDIGILPEYSGRSMHDFWQGYLKLLCDHAFCNAHLLRELIFIDEQLGPQKWAKDMMGCLISAKEDVERALSRGKNVLGHRKIRAIEDEYDLIIKKGLRKHPAPKKIVGKRGRTPLGKERSLLQRMRDHRSEILAFIYDFRVPFDNNLSERDIRMAKLKMKISGCFRSMDGARHFMRIRSYTSTVRKNGRAMLDALTAAFLGDPFMPRISG